MAFQIRSLTPGQDNHVQHAINVTAEQIKAATEMINRFGLNPTSHGQIVQALAINYLATVQASSK